MLPDYMLFYIFVYVNVLTQIGLAIQSCNSIIWL